MDWRKMTRAREGRGRPRAQAGVLRRAAHFCSMRLSAAVALAFCGFSSSDLL
jgi:hypothetical protein